MVEDVWLVERRKKCEKRKRRLLFYTTHPASLKTKIKKILKIFYGCEEGSIKLLLFTPTNLFHAISVKNDSS